MGDRANVKIMNDNDDIVFLYTHWAGTKLPITVQTALKRGRDRWGDPGYLTRIIFSDMIRDHIDGLAGYGISATVGDGDDRIVEVDNVKLTVRIHGHQWTFDEYVKAPTGDLDWDSALPA